MDFLLLSISTILVFLLLIYIMTRQEHSQLQNIFCCNLLCVFIIGFGVLMQDVCSKRFGIDPIYFEYFIYIGTCFIPVTIFFTGLIFTKTKIHFKKKYLLLFIVPLTSLLILWTNPMHHLFYESYSSNINECVYGPYITVHHIYTYLLLFAGAFYLTKFSVKNSGFFSKQSLLIVLGISVPVVVSILGSFKIIPMTVYMTPISFAVTVICFTLAIYKFKFLSITPIALQRIVDRMSDSYLVINENNIITDFNETFLKTFHFTANDVRNRDFAKLLQSRDGMLDELILTLDKAKTSPETFTFERHFTKINKYFNIEINNITNNDNFLGILILFKDITQHVNDMNTIRANQDLLVEKERLASLGQMIGGIAHNLKTPIMSIAGASEGLRDLVKEYDASIEDPDVTPKDHHEIAHDMDVWIEKIKTHTSYMSDIITAVKGQAVTLSEDEADSFTIAELVKRIKILMKHELKNALIDMNVVINVDKNISLNGNVNSLVQVINNLISNAIQSYNGKTNESIELKIDGSDSYITISVTDRGCGMTDEVQEKLFKEMITTKGKNGTGLGLFMSYSTIRGNFNGNMNFTSKVGIGTTFNVELPF